MSLFSYAMKVYTCSSESVIAQYIPFSTPKFKIYKDIEFPYALYARLEDELNSLLSKVCIFNLKI